MPTILQISDPHVMSDCDGRMKGVPTFKSLRLVLEKAREECPDPSRVVLSGDLSQEHTAAGYELVRELLGDWTERSLLNPGNHDDRTEMRSVFSQVAGAGDDDVGFREEVGDWQLIGLDSHIPQQVHGELSDATLAKLQEWLSQDPERLTLIFIHHPPISVNSPWIDQIGLRNPDALAQVVNEVPGVRGIFCGHIHQVFEGMFGKIPVYSAPSTAFQFVPESDTAQLDHQPPGFRVIELQNTEFSTRVVRLDTVPFVPSDI